MNLLVLDASPRSGKSRSQLLSSTFAEVWNQHFPSDQVSVRNLSKEASHHLSDEWMKAAYTKPAERSIGMHEMLKQSDRFVAEILAADYLVVSSPMYNFSVPSCLKAYIDQVFRLGETFKLVAGEYVGLVPGKKAFIICAKGGYYSQHQEKQQTDFASPYLSHVFRTLGFPEVEVLDAEGLDISKDSEKESLLKTTQQINKAIGAVYESRNG